MSLFYYSYNSDGDPWLQYYKENEEKIKKRFLQDYVEGWTDEKRERMVPFIRR